MSKLTTMQSAEARTALLAFIVDSSDDAITAKTPHGVITSWNRGAELIYGYSSSEIIGKPMSVLIHPDRPDEMDVILARIRRGERVEHYETMRVRKDGQTISVSLTVSPIYDSNNILIGVSSIARDITECKRADESLRAASLYAQLDRGQPRPAGHDQSGRQNNRCQRSHHSCHGDQAGGVDRDGFFRLFH